MEGLYIGCIGVFTALFFIVFVDYISSVFKNSYIEWDVKTITAGDYSCELDISRTMWDNFLMKLRNEPPSNKTEIERFRDFIKKNLEDNLSKLPDLGYEEEAPERIEIAMISFAFDNA